MKSEAQTVDEYLETLPDDRREMVSTVREVIQANLPEGYEEGMEFGMIGYHVPLHTYPDTYNGHPLSYVSLSSQKNYVSLYLMCMYMNPELETWFVDQYKECIGKKPNMGKSCVRFKKIDELPLELVGQLVGRVSVDEYVRHYEESRAARGK